MPDSGRILVVGTTPDYIDWIRCSRPEEAFFLTDPVQRRLAKEPVPRPHEEILCELNDKNNIYRILSRHLRKFSIKKLAGITCFDCEYMALTSELALLLDLPYQSKEAIMNCRDKYKMKTRWQQAGVLCPRFCKVQTIDDAEAFLQTLAGEPCVMKPLSGSGSELTFLCNTPYEVAEALDYLRSGLKNREKQPMYSQINAGLNGIIAEELISGDEYSCDFWFDGDKVEIIRLTKKYLFSNETFGTAAAYELILNGQSPFNETEFLQLLKKAATSTELRSNTICMVDLIERRGKPVFIEIAPRPGGDCLPWLQRTASGLDILALSLDCAGRVFTIPEHQRMDVKHVALRLFAERPGIIRNIDTTLLARDRRVVNIYLRHQQGHEVKMPPEDYFSRILGHVIFKPVSDQTVPVQNEELTSQLKIEWE